MKPFTIMLAALLVMTALAKPVADHFRAQIAAHQQQMEKVK